MARTWALKEDSVNTTIIHWYSTRRHNCYADDSEHGIDGMNRLSGSSMQAMGAFVLSPKEECIMESEIKT